MSDNKIWTQEFREKIDILTEKLHKVNENKFNIKFEPPKPLPPKPKGKKRVMRKLPNGKRVRKE
jgi:hypothetical protein